jgi:hypothetical protein
LQSENWGWPDIQFLNWHSEIASVAFDQKDPDHQSSEHRECTE